MTTKPIEIFRPGTFAAMNGKQYAFTAADLQAIADSYDPATHEAPIVVGHPAHDAPAFGWVSGIRYENERLVVDPDQVDPAFADMVKAGRFKKISPAFYEPDSPANPTPGKWHLRHVGFLGAHPPSVKGLKQAAFAAGERFVAFGDMERAGRVFRDIASALQRIRDWMIEDRGLETADKLLPGWQIESINEQSARLDEPPPQFAEPKHGDDNVTDKTLDAKRQKELDDRDAAIAAKEADLAKRAQAARHATDAAFVEGLVADGRVLPAEKEGLVAFMGTLPETADAVAFGEGDTAKKTSAIAFMQGFLKGLPKRVDFNERAPGAGGAGDPPDENAVVFAEQIRAEQKKTLDETGREISGSEAAERIKRRAV